MLPKGVRSARPGGRKRGPRTTSAAVEATRAHDGAEAEAPLPLTPAQETAAAPLLEAVASRTHRRVLLHGVTGAGKTEVYLVAIAAALAAGRQAIVMVPEIALTPQTIRRFAARFPGRVAVLHSALTESERAREWRRLRDGELDVVVGSRSAVFAPLPRLGIIVVDEEDAAAYKQDRIPRYHAVDVALERGRLEGVPVVLGSATPRVETFYAAHTGGFELVTLDQRVSGRPLPPIEVVDLREELRAGNRSPLSLELDRALRQCHEDGGQSILFLNRRGTATVVVCRNCGDALELRQLQRVARLPRVPAPLRLSLLRRLATHAGHLSQLRVHRHPRARHGHRAPRGGGARALPVTAPAAHGPRHHGQPRRLLHHL